MKWIALSDGGSVITIDHFSNGEKLPEIDVADTHYINVYQAVFSTQNEVFVITGSVVDETKIPEISKSIISAKVGSHDLSLMILAVCGFLYCLPRPYHLLSGRNRGRNR